MRIGLNPRSILLCLLWAIAAIVAAHMAMITLVLIHDEPIRGGIRALFDLDSEQNIPTLFSTLQLTAVSILAWLLRAEAKQSNRGESLIWTGLAVTFAALAVDEFCMLHEHLQDIGNRMLGWKLSLPFDWVIPYALMIGAVVSVLARSWWRLPSQTRWRIAAAGAVYVGGGLVVETCGSFMAMRYGWDSLQYLAEIVVEETMEMLGVALAIWALSSLLHDRRVGLDFVGPADAT